MRRSRFFYVHTDLGKEKLLDGSRKEEIFIVAIRIICTSLHFYYNIYMVNYDQAYYVSYHLVISSCSYLYR